MRAVERPGCPAWCTFDHDDPNLVYVEPGEHHRVLAGDDRDTVELGRHPDQPLEVWVYLDKADGVALPLPGAPARLREIAATLMEAASELEKLDLGTEAAQ